MKDFKYGKHGRFMFGKITSIELSKFLLFMILKVTIIDGTGTYEMVPGMH